MSCVHKHEQNTSSSRSGVRCSINIRITEAMEVVAMMEEQEGDGGGQVAELYVGTK